MSKVAKMAMSLVTRPSGFMCVSTEVCAWGGV